MESKIYYFEKKGAQNTDKVFEIVKKIADDKNIKDVVIASTSGATAVKAINVFDPKKYNLIAVTHASGFVKGKHQELLEENKTKLMQSQVKIVTGVHALSGIARSYKADIKPPIWTFTDLIGRTFRSILGDGFKVCLEICLMAADAGLITPEKEIISIGGRGTGADTALILKPAYTSNFLDLKIKEIICKPIDY